MYNVSFTNVPLLNNSVKKKPIDLNIIFGTQLDHKKLMLMRIF